jgi:diguanylate cyclase (GGDEF)-like protein
LANSIFPHVPTLGLAMFGVAGILCVLLTCTWLQNRNQRAVLYWAGMYALLSLGAILLARRGAIPDFLSITLANAVILLAAGLNWAGARAFEGRRTPFWWHAPAPLAWIVACEFTLLATNINGRAAVVSVVVAAFLFVTAYELWRGRAEKLVSRWAAITVLAIYGLMMLVRASLSFAEPIPDSRALFESGLFAAVALGSLLFTNALAFALLALTKERSELLHKRAAHVDPLTELLNRRAFFESGDICFARQAKRQRPLAALVFDLDRFKQVNDCHGHAVGDRVLEEFSRAVRSELRATDIVGRLGGEEFAALLPECSEEQALDAAERVRRAFTMAAIRNVPTDVAPTVSIGVAMAGRDANLSALLARADRAVYRAKSDGRNCIRLASMEPASTVVSAQNLGDCAAAA